MTSAADLAPLSRASGRPTTTGNPFPGPRPYGDSDHHPFAGRAEATRALASQIAVERAVTLYGPSGCGKSSLFAAGVLPLLQEERDSRCVMVKGWPESDDPVEGLLREMARALSVSVSARDEAARFGGAASRVERIVKWAMMRSSRPIVVYLDQIEQLLFPWRRSPEACEAVFEAAETLADLRVPGLSLVLAIREDFLGLFRARVRHRPRLLDAGFRLGRLTIGQMVDAACAAAAAGAPEQTWDRDATLALLRDLPAPGHPPTEEAEVEAVLAQIVCRAQWDLRASHPTEAPSAVDAKSTLRDYVNRTIRILGSAEDPARALLEKDLIDTNGGRRLLTKPQIKEALGGHGADPAACDEVIAHLESASILRHHEHQAEVYFELGHDLLARRLLEQRRVREAEEEQRLREAAAAREADERRKKAEADLSDAIAKAEAEREKAEKEQKRLRQRVLIAGILLLLAAGAGLWIYFEREKSRLHAKVAGVLVQQNLGGDPATALGVLLTLDASTTGYLELAHSAVRDPPARLTLRGHTDKLLGAAWSPDGKRILTYSKDGTARIFSADGAGEPLVLGGHPGEVRAADWSRSGARVVTVSGDMAVVWDAATGEALQGFPHARAVTIARFSPDETAIATGSNDATVAVWKIGSPEPLTVLSGHLGSVRDLAWSPDGTRLVSGSDDGTSMVWDPTLREPPRLLCCHPVGMKLPGLTSGAGTQDELFKLVAEAGIRHVEWRADGHAILSASFNTADSIGKALIRIWPVDEPPGPGATALDFGVSEATYTARFSPQGDRIAAAFTGLIARVWQLREPESAPVELRGHIGEVTDVAWSPDGQFVATASNDRTARVFRSNGSGVPLVLKGHKSRLKSVAFSPDGASLLTASDDGTARVWPTVEWNTVARTPGPVFGGVRSASVSRDGTLAAVATEGPPAVIALPLASPSAPLYVQTGSITQAVTWNRNGKRLATAPKGDTTVTVWSLEAATPIPETDAGRRGSRLRPDDPGARVLLVGHTGPIKGIDFAPDGRVATASLDATARIWDAATGKQQAVFEHTSERLRGIKGCRLYNLAWDPEGRRVLTACESGPAVIWDTAHPEAAPVILQGHTAAVEGVAWSPDGRHVVTTSWDQTARLWSADGSGTPDKLQHDSSVTWAEYSRDGTKLVTISWDERTVYVWDLTAPREDDEPWVPLRLRHDTTVATASFSPDGKSVIAVSNRSVRVWDLDAEALRRRLERLTADCLSPEARMEHLKESSSAALAKYRACEREHGRGGE